MDPATAAIAAAILTALAGMLASWWRGRIDAQRVGSQNELDEANADSARASATKAIQEAAAGAVELVRDATTEAQSRLQAMADDLTAARSELAAVRSELAAARDELHQAIAARNAAEQTIAALRGEVDRLRDRVRELETKVGGRRDDDAPGPALA